LETYFQIEVSSGDDGLVLTLRGELDLASAPALERELDGLADRRSVLVDMRGLEFIDSTGLRVLVKAHQQASESNREFAVVSSDEGQVRRLLDLTGLRERLNVVRSPEEPACGS
jgi:anti-sigma B factor antagonist